MERFQDGPVVVYLRYWRLQRDQKAIVYAWMSHVVADSNNEKCQSVQRSDEMGNAIIEGLRTGNLVAIWRKYFQLKKEVEDRLEDINDMPEVVVGNVRSVGIPACKEKLGKVA